MALANEDIKERFEIDGDRVIRWRAVSADGMPRWAQVKADEINRKAGEAVHFFPHQRGGNVTKIYGGFIAESRVRKVLQGQTAVDVGKVLAARERKAVSAAGKRSAAVAAPVPVQKPYSAPAPKAAPTLTPQAQRRQREDELMSRRPDNGDPAFAAWRLEFDQLNPMT